MMADPEHFMEDLQRSVEVDASKRRRKRRERIAKNLLCMLVQAQGDYMTGKAIGRNGDNVWPILAEDAVAGADALIAELDRA